MKKVAASKAKKKDVITHNLKAINQANFLMVTLHSRFRQKIISRLLSQGATAVGDLVKVYKVDQSIVSQHLGILRKADLVTTKRKGKYIFYSVNKARLKELLGTVQMVSRVSMIH